MPTIEIPPAQAALSGPAGGGWGYATPTPYSGSGINQITGVKIRPGDIFADSPPIGKETYLVTGLYIPYAAQTDMNVAGPSAYSIQTGLQLFRDSDLVYAAVDQQNAENMVSAGNAQWLAQGVFAADLVNPIAIRPGERLNLKVGILTGYQNNWVTIGVLASFVTNSPVSFARTPATIAHETLIRAAS